MAKDKKNPLKVALDFIGLGADEDIKKQAKKSEGGLGRQKVDRQGNVIKT